MITIGLPIKLIAIASVFNAAIADTTSTIGEVEINGKFSSYNAKRFYLYSLKHEAKIEGIIFNSISEKNTTTARMQFKPKFNDLIKGDLESITSTDNSASIALINACSLPTLHQTRLSEWFEPGSAKILPSLFKQDPSANARAQTWLKSLKEITYCAWINIPSKMSPDSRERRFHIMRFFKYDNSEFIKTTVTVLDAGRWKIDISRQYADFKTEAAINPKFSTLYWALLEKQPIELTYKAQPKNSSCNL